jgi:transposase
MHAECTKVQFTGQHVYLGMDIAKKSWKVCIYLGKVYHKHFAQPPDPEVLVDYLHRNFPGATYHSVYETGYFGFWIHRELIHLGVDSIVINPADVPTTDKERRTKTDRVDAAKLARALANGELTAIYVPERVLQEDRTLIRMRMAFVRKQTRAKNQIKALLQFYGYRVPPDITDRHWSRAYIRWLESLTFDHDTGRAAFQALLGELVALRATIAELTKQIRHMAQQDRYRAQVELLLSVSGIGLLGAMTFLCEVGTLERFKNLDCLLSYVGLVPGEHSTGDTEQDTGLNPRRNSALRYMLIECAWVAQREDPALLHAFTTYCKRMPKSMAIVPIARKLVSRMRFVLKHNQPYVTGVLSAG